MGGGASEVALRQWAVHISRDSSASRGRVTIFLLTTKDQSFV
jgi:hypothetical protein